MKLQIILAVFSLSAMLFSVQSAISQVHKADSIRAKATSVVDYKNELFFEFGGAGGIYSIGYERRIITSKNKQWKFDVSSDIAYYAKFRWPSDMMASIGLSCIFGQKHQIEAEITYIMSVNFDVPLSTLNEQLKAKRRGDNYALTITSVNSFGLGYRYQINKRITIRSKIQVLFKYDLEYEKMWAKGPWADIGVVYCFGK